METTNEIVRGLCADSDYLRTQAEAALKQRGSTVQAQILQQAGHTASAQDNPVLCRVYLDRALILWRQEDDVDALAETLGQVWEVALSQGDYAATRAYLEEGLELVPRSTRLDATSFPAGAHFWLGSIAQEEGDYNRAREHYALSLHLMEQLGPGERLDGSQIVVGLQGSLAYEQGDYAAARLLLERSLALARQEGTPHKIIAVLGDLCLVASRENTFPAAEAFLAKAVALIREHAFWYLLPLLLLARTRLAVEQADWEMAARALGAEDKFRRLEGEERVLHWKSEISVCLQATRSALSESAFEANWQEGSSLTLEQACRIAES